MRGISGRAEDSREGHDMAVMDAMPHVLLAVKDESMLQMIRDMLRRCSVERVKTYSSLQDAKMALPPRRGHSYIARFLKIIHIDNLRVGKSL